MSAELALSGAAASLFGADDPPPFERLNGAAEAPYLLVCDHASNRIPAPLERLGLDDAALRRHIAVDIGAGEITRVLAERLGAPAIVAAYSRLVIDNNRYLHDPTSVPEVSDGTPIPGNQGLTAADIEARRDQLFHPYHGAIDAALDDLAHRVPSPGLVSIHSFTPFFKGVERPWQIGLLWNKDRRIVGPLYEALSANRGIIVGENVPYSARDPYGYTVAEHADAHGRPNILIEIRQDLIDTHQGIETWADILCDALERVLADEGLYRGGGA